ncbi:MAG: S46 family peptidase [Cyclobacteriaceae bacterium]
MKFITISFVTILLNFNLLAQAPFNPDTVKAGVFDNGKMWTFDFPPTEYFEKTYKFKPTQEWFDGVRMSALRFANWCSASFVSADGLVMTNHHCAREVAMKVQKQGENFMNDGFYAQTMEEERKIPDLFVDQLVLIEDITQRVQNAFNKGKTDEEKVNLRNAEFENIKKEYGQIQAWKGLVLQPITLYQGARYSLYGFKRFTDVRLVIMPDLAVAFFGGDYDNFTYPRYCLDFTFFRVYDESGKAFKPEHYFKFNPDGVDENEPVFVVGNPGRTNRQATVAMLEYFRDVSWPTIIDLLDSRSKILQKYNEGAKSDSIVNVIFSYENSLKAIGGQLEGLRDPYIMARRKAFEKEFQEAVAKNDKNRPEAKGKSSVTIWSDIAATQNEIRKVYYESILFSPPEGFNSTAFRLAADLNTYALVGETDAKRAEDLKKTLLQRHNDIQEIETGYLSAHFKEANKYLGMNDKYVGAFLKYGNPDVAPATMLKKTKIYDLSFRKELLEKGAKAIARSDDPLLLLTKDATTRLESARAKMQQLNAKMAALRTRLSLMLYDVYGTRIPPDATFSLRFADGVVKPYNYNGTKAPVFTTFYGLYDRFYSFEQKYPWNLSEKWKNPPEDLLKAPVNFVSTNDIIGGNSGSPMINRNREVVGLIFDGNMESLPGNYIYLPERNRTVSVHAGGIMAGLKYIYKAERIVNELLK